jgi:hypothetical protein
LASSNLILDLGGRTTHVELQSGLPTATYVHKAV